jgi:hypothetical protein
MASNTRNSQTRSYTGRQWFYGGLLVFVVAVGLPIIGVPSLRTRLSDRILAIKASLRTDSIVPVTVAAANNSNPFPAEFEKTAREMKPAILPPIERIFTLQYKNAKPLPGVIVKNNRQQSTPSEANSEPSSKGRQEFNSIIEDSSTDDLRVVDDPSSPSARKEPKYQKGTMEQSAFDLLVSKNPTVADIVKGSHPGLHLKTWDAAKIDGDTYWVRLKLQADKNPESEYIWTVKMQSKEVVPLSFNAKSIS